MGIDYFIAKVQCKICRFFGEKCSNRTVLLEGEH